MMNMPLNLTPPAINPNAEKVLSKRYYRKDENLSLIHISEPTRH